MWVRNPVDRCNLKRRTEGTSKRSVRRSSQQPRLEALEDRQLLTASLQPITNLSVPAQQGAVLPLLALSTTTDPQTFTVTSSQPDIVASIIQGQFWNVGVSYTDPVTPANSFSGNADFPVVPELDAQHRQA